MRLWRQIYAGDRILDYFNGDYDKDSKLIYLDNELQYTFYQIRGLSAQVMMILDGSLRNRESI